MLAKMSAHTTHTTSGVRRVCWLDLNRYKLFTRLLSAHSSIHKSLRALSLPIHNKLCYHLPCVCVHIYCTQLIIKFALCDRTRDPKLNRCARLSVPALVQAKNERGTQQICVYTYYINFVPQAQDGTRTPAERV